MRGETRYWDRVASAPLDIHVATRGGEAIYSRIVADVVRKLDLNDADCLLDIGCGTGAMTRALAVRVAEVVGVDVSEGMVARAKRALADLPNASVRTCGLKTLPFDSPRFTKILCYSSVFNYIENYAEAEDYLREMLRVCRPGARVLIGDLLDRRQLEYYRQTFGTPDDLPKTPLMRLFFKLCREPVAFPIRVLKNPGGYLRLYRQHKLYAGELDSNMANEADHFWYDPDRLLDVAERLGVKAQVMAQPNELPFSSHRFDLLISVPGTS